VRERIGIALDQDCFIRDLPPCATDTEDGGTFSQRATNR